MKNYMYSLEKDANRFSVPTSIAEQGADTRNPEFLAKIQQTYGFLYALMGSPATNSIFVMEGGRRKYAQEIINCDTNEIEVSLGKTIWTELPEDIGTACCHTKPDVNGCLTKATPMRLCLKDCYDDLQEHFLRMARQGFNLFGGTNAESEYWAELKAWFLFFQARDIMYGKVGVTGNNVPSFPGVLDIMDKATVSFSGSDIIAAFEQIECRLGILGGNYIMGAHPMIIKGIEKAVNKNGVWYQGWSKDGAGLMFNNVRIVPDILIPINMEAGTGQIWAADLDKVGVFMERNLTDPFIETINNYTDSQDGKCFSKCNFLKNYGFAFTKDFNALFRVTDVAMSGACLGENTLLGLSSLIVPDTLVPTYK